MEDARKDGYYIVALRDKDSQLFMSRCYSHAGKLYLLEHELFKQRFRYIEVSPGHVHDVYIDSYQESI